jgi:enoyl-CoA hydratase
LVDWLVGSGIRSDQRGLVDDAAGRDDVTGDYRTIRIEHEESLSWIVLDRPDAANALSTEMLDEISSALELLKTEGGKVLGIRGEGKGFCAGYDLGQVGTPRAADPVADRTRLQRNLERWFAIWDHPKPVIAAVHGYCVAGGNQMVLFTDITVVAEDARIAEPGIPLGGGFIAPMWATLVGPKRAKEFSFVPGNAIDGRTAVEWGWANHAVPADRLLDTVRTIAASMKDVPADVLALKKLSINRAMEAQGFRQAAAAVADADALLHLAPEVVAIRERMGTEGLKAVLDTYRVPRTTDLSRRTDGDV